MNFGRGCEVLKSKLDGKDLIVTFKGKGSGITADEFAPKLIGKDKQGKVVFGYASLPYVDYKPAILSARRPVYNKEQGCINVEIQNFGLSASKDTEIEVLCNGTSLGKTTIGVLKPYEAQNISLTVASVPDKQATYEVIFFSDGKEVERNTLVYIETRKK